MRNRKGVTLTELMIAGAIMSIGILGMVGAFKFFNVGIQSAKTRSLANNIAQERIEFLKNKSYYRVLVTTQTATDGNFSPSMVYDAAPNGEETVNVGGLTFTRRVYIRKVNEDTSGNLTYLSWNSPDTGLKEIKIYVVWFERGEWRKLEIRNLRENPNRVNQSATVSGRAYNAATSANIQGVVVRAQESPSQYGETDSGGVYSFGIEPGTYTLLATKDGYFPRTLPSFGVASGGTAPGKDFALVQMSSGAITGKAWKRDHLVISQVVSSTAMASGVEIEYVELYNPTTAAINVGDAVNGNVVKLKYYGESGLGQDIGEFSLSYISTYVPAGRYYLIANSFPLTVAGGSPVTNALFSASNRPPCDLTGTTLNCIRREKAGAIAIADSAGRIIDAVGWSDNSEGKTPSLWEGSYVSLAEGIKANAQLVRYSLAGSAVAGDGRAYDTNNNSNDFTYLSTATIPPYWTGNGYKAPTSGTPAAGGIVFADDSLSSPVTAASDGSFNLASVSTGSWTVYVSSGLVFSSVAYYGGLSDGFVSSVGDIVLASSTVYGYVTGRVADVGDTALSGIRMFSAGSSPVTTNASGRYTLPVTAGVVTVVANYQTQSPSYVEISSMDITVGLGEVVKDVDFSLYYGGKIRGRVTTNGVDPLPNIPVVGIKNGVEQGNGISDVNGYFLISGASISTGTYQVVPQLEAGESSSPSSSTVVVTAGSIVFAATYTVSGAFGYVTGSARTGSASGPAITTGVLIYVTTATLAAGAFPPDITPALRGSTGVYYAVSSNALGNYSVPVKGGYSYNVYAWYTTWSGGVATTTRKDSLGVSVQPAATQTVDFFW